jgi:hypothetical protein
MQADATLPVKGEGRREKGEGRREKGEGRREKGEGRREKGEGCLLRSGPVNPGQTAVI